MAISLPGEFQTSANIENENSQTSSKVLHLAELALQEANASNPEYKNDIEIQKRQKQILSTLPENLIEILTAHLKATHIEQLKYPSSRPETIIDKNILKGEIFEKLVTCEDDLFKLDSDSAENLQSEEQKTVAGQLLAVMANPERFNLEQHATRNPDLVKIIFDKGVFYIGSWMEVKTHLDARAFEQLLNFKKSFKFTIDNVNKLENAKAHGLQNLGMEGNQLNLSENCYQVLVVPRDAILNDEDGKSSFIDKRLPPAQRERLISLLNEKSLIKIARSCFSMVEIDAITRNFLNEVNRRLDQEAEAASI